MAATTSSLQHSSHVATSFTSSNNRNSLSSFTDHTSTFLNFKKHLVFLSSSHTLSSSSSQQLHLTHVSTVPVEYAPPAPEFNFEKDITRLRNLRLKVSKAGSLEMKHRVVDGDSQVNQFFNSSQNQFSRVSKSVELDSFEMYLIKCVVAAGQEHVISYGVEEVEEEGRSCLLWWSWGGGGFLVGGAGGLEVVELV